MRYRDSDLRGVPVTTKSGRKLGKLAAFVVDPEHHEVRQYVVTKATLISKLFPDELLIAPAQVISLDADLMVVEDGAVAEKAEAVALPKGAEAAPHAMHREG
jgi:sporulation protein YlmC with PRC-barrel domain